MKGVHVSVTSAATLLLDQGGHIAPAAGVVKNAGTVSIDLGGSDVTTGAGYTLGPGEAVAIDLPGGSGEKLYGIAPSGTVPVLVLRTGS